MKQIRYTANPGCSAGPAAPAPATPRTGGHGITPIPEDTPLTCWLPARPRLTPHGLRHGHKTWIAEDGTPEILAEQRLGHDVPGVRRPLRARLRPHAQ